MIKPSLATRLQQLCERHEELAHLLGDAAVISDQARFRGYSREFSELEPVVSAFARYRRALDEALGDASLVLPTWRAWLGIVARHGDSPDRSVLTDAEREVAERWLAAEAAATTAAFGPHRYLDEARFDIGL